MSVRDTVERTARNWDRIYVRVGDETKLLKDLDEGQQSAFVIDWVARAARDQPDDARVGCLICGMLMRDVGYHVHTVTEIAAHKARVVRPDQIAPDPTQPVVEAVARWLEKRCDLLHRLADQSPEPKRPALHEQAHDSAAYARLVRAIPLNVLAEMVENP